MELDLGRTVAIGKIRLLPALSVTGQAVQIFGGADQAHLRLVYDLHPSLINGQWIEATGDGVDTSPTAPHYLGDIRYLRVSSTASAWREVEVYSSIEYFGYFGVEQDFPATADTGMNLGMIVHGVVNDDGTYRWDEVDAARRRGGKVLLDVSTLAFVGGKAQQGLLPNWDTSIDAWINTLVAKGYGDTIAGFFLGDEPTYNAPGGACNAWVVSSHIGQQPWAKPTSVNLEVSVLNVIATYAQSPITCAAAGNITRTQVDWFQNTFDWVSFDCYKPFDQCRANNAVLRSLLSARQRMMAVPEAFSNADATSQSTLVQTTLDPWNAELLSDAKYIAVLPYSWKCPSGAQSCGDTAGRFADPVGASAAPLVAARFGKMARSFLSFDQPGPRSTFLTASPSGPARDGYHVDVAGRLWHQRDGGTSWDLLSGAPAVFTGGIARLTNPARGNFDSIALVGSNGHLVQYVQQNGNGSHAFYDMGLPLNCDRVIGNPSTATIPGTGGNLDITYRCANDHVQTAYMLPSGVWTTVDVGVVPSGAASDPAEAIAGGFGYVYVSGTDGLLYRCVAGSGCAAETGNNFAYGTHLVGAPGVAFSASRSTSRWVLAADRAGQAWSYDAWNGIWTNVGVAPCGKVEGDLSVANDDVNGNWWGAARCVAEDQIAVLAMTPTNSWHWLRTASWGQLPLGKPLVSTYAITGYSVGNVSFETSTGEQALAYSYYQNGLLTQSSWFGGTLDP